MKKYYFLVTSVFSLYLGLNALPVDQNAAKAIAGKFMNTNNLTLSTTYHTIQNDVALYVFNSDNGFIIIAGNDCETPIIGYSYECRFNPENVPEQLEDYLQDFVARIQYGIEHQIVPDEVTATQWESTRTKGQPNKDNTSKSVDPLLTDKWSQGCLYNNACPPFENAPCGHARVGCVALAMAQTMRYWEYPTTGWGSNTYSNGTSILSADFGNTSYQWQLMPDSLTNNSSEAQIEALATLLYHCGLAVNTNYAPDESNSIFDNLLNALVRYFDYSRQLHLEKRSKYNDDEWISMIKESLDQGRPVIYSGSGNETHAFVCDGYDENDLLHFNWGWGGNANGYFALGNLYPNGNSLNKKNSAIFDIIPQYEPFLVTATAFPANAGTVEGIGEYHIGASCTLTAVPAENCKFSYWKRDGKVVSNRTEYSIDNLDEDINNIEACFSFVQADFVTVSLYPDANDPGASSVSLSWNGQISSEWPLLATIHTDSLDLQAVTTDNENIYTFDGGYDVYGSVNPSPLTCFKYNMDGELTGQLQIDGCYPPHALAFDGTYFYCVQQDFDGESLACVDLVNQTLVYSARFPMFSSVVANLCTYDPINDGFWILAGLPSKLRLVDRQAQTLIEGPRCNNMGEGSCYFTAEDGSPHIFLFNGIKINDFDIVNDYVTDNPLYNFQNEYFGRSCTGVYQGKQALFVTYYDRVDIYEINCRLSQVVNFRLYRSKSEGETVMLADEVDSYSYVDTTWQNLEAGRYRFGVSAVFANGAESETVWSDFIEKQDIGLEENDYPSIPSVQKVFENGHVVIIKDGKKYSVTGQELTK